MGTFHYSRTVDEIIQTAHREIKVGYANAEWEYLEDFVEEKIGNCDDWVSLSYEDASSDVVECAATFAQQHADKDLTYTEDDDCLSGFLFVGKPEDIVKKLAHDFSGWTQ